MRHAFELRRNGDQLANVIYWPIVNVLVWGFFTVYLRKSGALHPGLVAALLGAAILWNLFTGMQREMSVGFLEDVWSRNVANLFASPLTVTEYTAGLVVMSLAKVGVGLFVAGAIAWSCYRYDVFPDLLALMPFLLNLTLFALAIAIVITAVIVRYGSTFQTLAWSFAGILMPVSCVFYPLVSLPQFLRPIAWLLPTTQSFEGMRQVVGGGGVSTLHFTWGFGLNVAAMALAIAFFSRMFASAKARGVLLRAG
jgi:ABC-2 type transport system permease protein